MPPHQESLQKSASSPFPILMILLVKYKSFILIRSIHTGELFGLFFRVATPPFILYFFLTIPYHMPSPFSIFYHHLHNRLMFLTPNSPFFFDFVITAHSPGGISF
jgi:hypothetical protein